MWVSDEKRSAAYGTSNHYKKKEAKFNEWRERHPHEQKEEKVPKEWAEAGVGREMGPAC